MKFSSFSTLCLFASCGFVASHKPHSFNRNHHHHHHRSQRSASSWLMEQLEPLKEEFADFVQELAFKREQKTEEEEPQRSQGRSFNNQQYHYQSQFPPTFSEAFKNKNWSPANYFPTERQSTFGIEQGLAPIRECGFLPPERYSYEKESKEESYEKYSYERECYERRNNPYKRFFFGECGEEESSSEEVEPTSFFDDPEENEVLQPGAFLVPEPMVFDLVLGLGHRRGEFEVSYLSIIPFNGIDPILTGPEIKIAVENGTTLEMELLYLDDILEDIRFRAQYTFNQKQCNVIDALHTILYIGVGIPTIKADVFYVNAIKYDDQFSHTLMAGFLTEVKYREGEEGSEEIDEVGEEVAGRKKRSVMDMNADKVEQIRGLMRSLKSDQSFKERFLNFNVNNLLPVSGGNSEEHHSTEVEEGPEVENVGLLWNESWFMKLTKFIVIGFEVNLFLSHKWDHEFYIHLFPQVHMRIVEGLMVKFGPGLYLEQENRVIPVFVHRIVYETNILKGEEEEEFSFESFESAESESREEEEPSFEQLESEFEEAAERNDYNRYSYLNKRMLQRFAKKDPSPREQHEQYYQPRR